MIPYESWAPPRTAPITAPERTAGRIAWGVIAVVLLLITAALLSSCAGTKAQREVERYYKNRSFPAAQTPPVEAKAQRSISRTDSVAVYTNTRDASTASNPALLPGFTDFIGISTPEGRARRQAVKLAKASVPRSIGKGAVYAPLAKQVANSYKSTAPAVAADSGATVSNAAANSQQQNVQGDGNDVSAKQANPTAEAPGPLAVIADNLSGPLGAVLGLAAAAGIVVILLRRKAAKTIV